MDQPRPHLEWCSPTTARRAGPGHGVKPVPKLVAQSRVTKVLSSPERASAERALHAAHTQDQDGEVDEDLKRGGCAVHSVPEPAEAFQPSDGSLDDEALPLERGVLGIELADGLLSRDAAPGGNHRPEPMIVSKLPEAQTVVALVG